MQRRFVSNVLKIIGLLCIASLAWRSSQNSFANPINRNLEASTTPKSLRSLVPTQLKKPIESPTGVSKQTTKEDSERDKLCDDRSDAYLDLPLQEVDPTFRPCASELLKRTEVPIVLPLTPYTKPIREKLYAYLSTNVDYYSIELTSKQGNHYHYLIGWFSGGKLTAESPTLLQQYEKSLEGEREAIRFDETEAGLVRLSQGIEGYYIPYTCSVNCHTAFSIVTWDQQGYRYCMAIKMGKKAEVLELVNAAIENQRVLPDESRDTDSSSAK